MHSDYQQQPPRRGPLLKNPYLYSSAVLAVAALAVIWIFFSRWQENRLIERKGVQEKTQKRQQSDRAALEQLGGKELTIQSFYGPTSIAKGETAKLCYGVANAKTVTLEPQPTPVWPSYARCVDVTPAKNTVYTLTIEDADGNTKMQSLEVKVH